MNTLVSVDLLGFGDQVCQVYLLSPCSASGNDHSSKELLSGDRNMELDPALGHYLLLNPSSRQHQTMSSVNGSIHI